MFKEDIYKKIQTDFPANDIDAVKEVLLEAIAPALNVGEDQFVRSLVFLADKDIDELKRIVRDYGDPRDIIWEAEHRAGNQGHWFTIPFEQIEALKGGKYTGRISSDKKKKDGGLGI